MKKTMKKILTVSLFMSLSLSSLTYAAEWKHDIKGWWWQNNDGSYPASCWQWIDGNNDGVSECYYFDATGYMLANTTTPDNYTVNENGAWTVNGIVQTKAAETTQGESQRSYYGSYSDSDTITEEELIEQERNYDPSKDPAYREPEPIVDHGTPDPDTLKIDVNEIMKREGITWREFD